MLDVERMLPVEKGAELARRAYTLLELHGVETNGLMSYDPPGWHFYQTRYGVTVVRKMRYIYHDTKERCEVERENLDKAVIELRKMMVLEDVADA